MQAVRKLTTLPVRLVINTEVHPDHTTGNFVFSPPALVVNHAGASDAMRKAFDPERANTLAKQSPEMREAAQGYRLVTPHIEYQDRTTLRVGERVFQLIHMRNVHSEADTAVWLPNERVLFAASVAFPGSINNIRPFVQIPDMLAAMKMMKSLTPDVVVPGHGSFGTVKIFDDNERYYTLLLERVGALVRAGRTLEQAKQELRMPEYVDGRTRSGCRAMSRPPTGQSPRADREGAYLQSGKPGAMEYAIAVGLDLLERHELVRAV